MANFFVRSRPTTSWVANTAKALGDRVKATSTTAFLGKHFECTTAGTTHGTTEPTWNTTIGGTTSDGTVTWTTRGSANLWAASKDYAVGDRVVKTSRTLTNASSVVWDCTTAGTSHTSEPSWATTITAGTTTQAEGSGTVVWTARACTTWDNANLFLDALLKDVTNTSVRVGAGDRVYISKNHAESTANSAVTITSPGTQTNPTEFVCVNDNADPSTPTAVAVTASITTTSSGTIAFAGYAYCYGVAFNSGTGNNVSHIQVTNSAAGLWTFEACALNMPNTSTSSIMTIGATGTKSKNVLINTTVSFGSTSHKIKLIADLDWFGTASAITGATFPTTLFTGASQGETAPRVNISGVDLSALGSGKNLIDVSQLMGGVYTLSNCKLGASVTVSTGTHTGLAGFEINLINCDSADTNYRYYRENHGGTIVHEATIVRTGGASDGTTPLSWKMVSNANVKFPYFALKSAPIIAWQNTTGSSKTATIEIINDGVTLKDDEVFVELEYLGTVNLPLSLFAKSQKASIVATAANLTTSTVAWTTTGLGSAVKQKISVSFTPQELGPIRATVYVAKASQSVFIDPLIALA